MSGPPPGPGAPWRDGHALDARAGGLAFAAGWRAPLAWRTLLLVTLLGLVTAAFGVALDGTAWRLAGGDPVARGLLLLAAAAGWTWVGAAWARFAVGRACDLLERDGRPGVGGAAHRRGPAEAAAALAATPPVALLLLVPLLLQRLGAGGLSRSDLLVLPGALGVVVLALLLPLGACALTLDRGLPPLAALAAVLRGVVRGWASVAPVVLLHTLILAGAIGVGALIGPGAALVWLAWIPVQGSAGSTALVALALGWAANDAAREPWAPRWTSVPPPPPRWLVPAAGLLLRVAFGVTLATEPLLDAVGTLTVPVGALAASAGAIGAPWLIGAALLHLHLTRHRSVVLDDDGLRLDPGPTWPGTRVPWSRVRGACARDDGVALVVGWRELLFRCAGDQVDPLLQWLQARGVRRSDA